jgi:hypothetical protein
VLLDSREVECRSGVEVQDREWGQELVHSSEIGFRPGRVEGAVSKFGDRDRRYPKVGRVDATQSLGECGELFSEK